MEPIKAEFKLESVSVFQSSAMFNLVGVAKCKAGENVIVIRGGGYAQGSCRSIEPWKNKGVVHKRWACDFVEWKCYHEITDDLGLGPRFDATRETRIFVARKNDMKVINRNPEMRCY